MPLYAAHGVPWLWLIDPLARTLEVHRREPEGYLFLGVFTGQVAVRAPPFDAVPLELGLLWGDAPAAARPERG
jgi:Uma2 family endonuclease